METIPHDAITVVSQLTYSLPYDGDEPPHPASAQGAHLVHLISAPFERALGWTRLYFDTELRITNLVVGGGACRATITLRSLVTGDVESEEHALDLIVDILDEIRHARPDNALDVHSVASMPWLVAILIEKIEQLDGLMLSAMEDCEIAREHVEHTQGVCDDGEPHHPIEVRLQELGLEYTTSNLVTVRYARKQVVMLLERAREELGHGITR